MICLIYRYVEFGRNVQSSADIFYNHVRTYLVQFYTEWQRLTVCIIYIIVICVNTCNCELVLFF